MLCIISNQACDIEQHAYVACSLFCSSSNYADQMPCYVLTSFTGSSKTKLHCKLASALYSWLWLYQHILHQKYPIAMKEICSREKKCYRLATYTAFLAHYADMSTSDQGLTVNWEPRLSCLWLDLGSCMGKFSALYKQISVEYSKDHCQGRLATISTQSSWCGSLILFSTSLRWQYHKFRLQLAPCYLLFTQPFMLSLLCFSDKNKNGKYSKR